MVVVLAVPKEACVRVANVRSAEESSAAEWAPCGLADYSAGLMVHDSVLVGVSAQPSAVGPVPAYFPADLVVLTAHGSTPVDYW